MKYKVGDLVLTVFCSTALILDAMTIRKCNLYRVRCLNWTPEQIEKMGGPKEAWILISEDQIVGLKEDQNEDD